jgi:hypothetical protein
VAPYTFRRLKLFNTVTGEGLWYPWKGRLSPRTATVERPWTAHSVPWNGCHKALLDS